MGTRRDVFLARNIPHNVVTTKQATQISMRLRSAYLPLASKHMGDVCAIVVIMFVIIFVF